jgi:membrane protein
MKSLVPLLFTLGGLAFAYAAAFALAAPSAVEPVVGEATATLMRWIAYPLVFAGIGLVLAVLYRYGPDRDHAKWRWVSWGSALALIAWLAMSVGFSIYLSNFANYDRTYGPLGAAIGFMMWVYLSSQVVLLGAELNAEIEHQTARDTTTGPPRPMGERGAVMADTVGKPQ